MVSFVCLLLCVCVWVWVCVFCFCFLSRRLDDALYKNMAIGNPTSDTNKGVWHLHCTVNLWIHSHRIKSYFSDQSSSALKLRTRLFVIWMKILKMLKTNLDMVSCHSSSIKLSFKKSAPLILALPYYYHDMSWSYYFHDCSEQVHHKNFIINWAEPAEWTYFSSHTHVCEDHPGFN